MQIRAAAIFPNVPRARTHTHSQNSPVRFSRDTRQGRRMTRVFSRYRENSDRTARRTFGVHTSLTNVQFLVDDVPFENQTLAFFDIAHYCL